MHVLDSLDLKVLWFEFASLWLKLNLDNHIIDTIMYSDKNQQYFHKGLILMFYGIFVWSEMYAWAPCILAQLYQGLHNFISMKKEGKIVAHTFLLQVWTYEHISISHPFLAIAYDLEDLHWFRWQTIHQVSISYSVEECRHLIDHLDEDDIIWDPNFE